MRWVRLAVLAGGGLLVARSGYAQSVPDDTRVSRSGKVILRIMVANPYSPAAADSAAAVQIGTGMREQAAEFVGDDYRVVSQDNMNEALAQFGYPIDAILSPSSSVDLAKQINARIVVASTMEKATSGQYQVTARLSGVNDLAGQVAVLLKMPAEPLNDFGRRIADTLQQAVKAMGDAKECIGLIEDESGKKGLKWAEKAQKLAEKAIKRVPNHALAHICLVRLADTSNANTPVEEKIQHWEAVVQGDPMSLVGWRQLTNAYSTTHDTAKVIMAAQRWLEVAPADQDLRADIAGYFLGIEKQDLALNLANEGIKVDPGNARFYDIKSTACLRINDFSCAFDALQGLYQADSTKADTVFFQKILGVAAQVADTADLLQWAQTAVRKYPANPVLLDRLHVAYIWTNQHDSSIAVARQIIQLDPANPRTGKTAVTAVQLLVQGNRIGEAEPFVQFVEQHGGPAEQNRLAGVLVPVARDRLVGDSTTGVQADLQGAVDLARRALKLADSTTNTKNFETGSYILGLALLRQVGEMDDMMEKQQSCDMARQEQQLLIEAKGHLLKVQGGQGTNQSKAQQYLDFIEKFDPRVASLLKQFCR